MCTFLCTGPYPGFPFHCSLKPDDGDFYCADFWEQLT
jgi:hypothetical protein